ncbi:membrane dipeptidase [Canibacter zhoujuaniae]|uniref:membrane dipeptidase n=1 Tax=Canibacter zhoujuaniae TaxID=2708343 RepID=UPI001AB03713|nr:membrane dipeptidase [Canibacter zhoujuaniae]
MDITNIRVIDGHNDLAWAARQKLDYGVTGLAGSANGELAPVIAGLHTDLPRLLKGQVGGQFWSVWVDPTLRGADQVVATLEQIDWVRRFIAAHPEQLEFTPTAAQMRQALSAGRIASLIGIEGGEQIGGSTAALRQFARLGARYMTLTWSRTTDWADSATDTAQHGGLTDFGRAVVREMNRIGMLVDLAHVSPDTMRAALDESCRPVIVSHSCASALCDHPRNVPDDVLQRIGAGGGVIMVAFVPTFVSQARRDWWESGGLGEGPQVTVQDVADHIEHIRKVAGVHAVGLGADYDGTDDMPAGLEDVSGYPLLLQELADRGWTEEELRGLASENILRVLETVDADYEAFIAGSAGAPAHELVTPVKTVSDSEMPQVLFVVNWATSLPRRFETWFTEAGFKLDIRFGKEVELPKNLDDYAGMVLFGGGLMPDEFENAPWLKQERQLAQEAIDKDIPTLGICLGAQILADVAGGEVKAKTGPKERGSTVIKTTAAGRNDQLISVLGTASPMIENHEDMITRLPESAVLLASSDAIEIQAFRINENVYGLQFHPEVSAADMWGWNAEELASEGFNLAELCLEAGKNDAANTAAARALAGSFSEIMHRYAAG